MGDSVDNLREIVWCNHLKITPRPLVHTEVPHVYIHSRCYLAVEEGKVKILCPDCWIDGVRAISFSL
jgi:hypothetical protein